MSPVALNGIKDLGQNAMLLCTACVNNNERDAFILNRTMMQVNDRPTQCAAKLESIEAKVTDLSKGGKFNEAMRKINEIVGESYASVVKKLEDNKKVTMSQPPKKRKISLSHNIEMNFIAQGMQEDPDKNCDQKFVSTYEHVTYILKTIGVEAEIVNLRRLGKFQK